MSISQGIEVLMALIALSGRVVGMISKVTRIIRSAQAEGRDLTEAEIGLIRGIDDTARRGLAAAIEKAKGT